MERLKEVLCSPPILAYPPGEEFIVDADASNTGVGGVLSQNQDGEEQVIAYFNKALSKPERNYCVTRKELLAILKTVEHFHKYLYGQKFKLRTDLLTRIVKYSNQISSLAMSTLFTCCIWL